MQQSMTAAQPQVIDPEYRKACLAAYNGWKDGSIQFKAALDQLQEYERQAATEQQYANQGYSQTLLGMIYGYRAELDMSIRHFVRARDLFERAKNPEQVVRTTMNLGETYRLKGDFPRARQYFNSAYAAATEFGILTTQAYAASNEGHLLMAMGQLEQAREKFELSIEHGKHIAETDASLEIQSQSRQGLATYYLEVGDTSAAWKQAVESLRLSREQGNPLMLGFAYRTMGEVLTALGELPKDTPAAVVDDAAVPQDAAATNESLGDPDMFFQLAIQSFSDFKADGETARTIFQQGASLLKRGQKVTASRKFHQAMLMFTKLGMKDDAAKAAQAQMDAQAL